MRGMPVVYALKGESSSNSEGSSTAQASPAAQQANPIQNVVEGGLKVSGIKIPPWLYSINMTILYIIHSILMRQLYTSRYDNLPPSPQLPRTPVEANMSR